MIIWKHDYMVEFAKLIFHLRNSLIKRKENSFKWIEERNCSDIFQMKFFTRDKKTCVGGRVFGME